MLISCNWLNEYIPHSLSPEQLAEKLTAAGLEVEGIETQEDIPGGLRGLVLGTVQTCVQHPNADKLSLTTVCVGEDEPLQIVCGAPNVAAGQRVVVATVGTMLYPAEGEPFKIKKGKIRGEVSLGMICAEDEIGLGASHDGILVLETDLPDGTPAAEYFKPGSDTVLEIGLTPNRADAASHYGVARDLRVLLGQELQRPEAPELAAETDSFPNVKITVENTEACPRYAGLTLTGVKVGPSPDWLQKRLRSIGLTPKNNVVDITNYILHAFGQPLHAFDADQITKGEIIVTTLPEGTPFLALDEEEYKLKAEDLMICDGERNPLCIGGVFGGLHSGVSEKTTNVFLESAYFHPDFIRRSSTVHDLKTDAAYRFARGTDPNGVPYALRLAAKLIRETGGGEICGAEQDLYPNPIPNYEFSVKWERLNTLMGVEIPRERVFEILRGLEIEIVAENEESFALSVPPYRVDVTGTADIAEEVLRIYGFNNVPLPETLASDFFADFPTNERLLQEDNLQRFLAGRGFTEIQTNSISHSKYSQALGIEAQDVKLLNALSSELDVMRQAPAFSGLEVVAHNINRQNPSLKLFEFAKSYHKTEEGYAEKHHLCLWLTGEAVSTSWREKARNVDFYDLKSHLAQLLQQLSLNPQTAETLPADDALFAYGASYGFRTGKDSSETLVRLGLIRPKQARLAEVSQEVFYLELDWDVARKRMQPQASYQPLPKFPVVRRDLSLVLDRAVRYEEVLNVAQRTEKKLLKEVQLFDLYEGERIDEDKKALALAFLLQDDSKTLNDKTIDKTMTRLIAAFEKQLGAVIRR